MKNFFNELSFSMILSILFVIFLSIAIIKESDIRIVVFWGVMSLWNMGAHINSKISKL